MPDTKKKVYAVIMNMYLDILREDGDPRDEMTRVAMEIWPDRTFNPSVLEGYTRSLLYKEIPFSESNENIAKEMEDVLRKIKEYRDQHYPL